jgi:Uma2 family endonuclease
VSKLTAPPSTVGTAPKAWPLSIAAYHALGEMGLIPEKTELLFGQVFEKTPKTPLHAFLVRRLLALLAERLPPGLLLRKEDPIRCGESEPEPDLAVVRGREEDFRERHPTSAELVIEICVTSHDYDRSKLAIYAAAGIAECWLVLGPERRIEAHRRPVGAAYTEVRVHQPGEVLESVSVPELALSLDSVFEP